MRIAECVLKPFLISLFLAVMVCGGSAMAQGVPVVPADSTVLPQADCCGPISPEGVQLSQLIDSMDVEHLWLADAFVDWRTGKKLHEENSKSTHCSAFAAAVGYHLNVYMLRPPEHPTLFLASAQVHWFSSKEAQREGWRPVSSQMEAQRLANTGSLVIIGYATEGGDADAHGHIVVVRPAVKTNKQLANEGPQVAQAATHNRSSDAAANSFHAHPGAWPTKVEYYAHDVDWSAPRTTAGAQ